MLQFEPFKDEATSLTLEQMTVESRRDRIEIYGSLQITLDCAGLERARQLKAVIDATVAALEKQELPAQVATRPSKRVANPFD